MRTVLGLALLWGALSPCVASSDVIEKISLSPTSEIQRADLYIWKEIKRPQAVLVLCPGHNGNGESLVRQTVWQEFARKYKLGLVGLSFASSGNTYENKRGYYYAAEGSGELLLAGLRKAYGKDLPLLLYGFSGGAHFTARFEEWKPERMVAWCAYSAGWWEEPQRMESKPPGIVICGDEDGRYGASLIYFKQGRAAGKPWLWISVPKTGHSPLPTVENFVRDYFAAVLDKSETTGMWIDIDRKNEAKPEDIQSIPSVTAWLPDKNLFAAWQAVHEP